MKKILTILSLTLSIYTNAQIGDISICEAGSSYYLQNLIGTWSNQNTKERFYVADEKLTVEYYTNKNNQWVFISTSNPRVTRIDGKYYIEAYNSITQSYLVFNYFTNNEGDLIFRQVDKTQTYLFDGIYSTNQFRDFLAENYYNDDVYPNYERFYPQSNSNSSLTLSDVAQVGVATLALGTLIYLLLDGTESTPYSSQTREIVGYDKSHSPIYSGYSSQEKYYDSNHNPIDR